MVCGQTCSTGKKGNLSGTSGARLRMGEGGGGCPSTTGAQFRGEVQLLLQGGSEGVEFKNIRGGAAQEVGEFK